MNIRPAALIVQNDTILLLKYVYNNKIVYNLPGGNHEKGEALNETLVREMMEELGIEVKIDDLKLVVEATRNDAKNEILHLIFGCEIINNEPVINSKETSAIDVVWLPVDQIAEVNLYPNIGAQLLNSINERLSKLYIGQINQPWY